MKQRLKDTMPHWFYFKEPSQHSQITFTFYIDVARLPLSLWNSLLLPFCAIFCLRFETSLTLGSRPKTAYTEIWIISSHNFCSKQAIEIRNRAWCVLGDLFSKRSALKRDSLKSKRSSFDQLCKLNRKKPQNWRMRYPRKPRTSALLFDLNSKLTT